MIESAAIIGLGLIGGSLARDLAARGVRVFAVDAELDTFRKAFEEGVVENFLPEADGLIQADVVVFAIPVSAAAYTLHGIAPRLHGVRLVTDVGSTKLSIVSTAQANGIGARFVGSHPLAGDHRSGWDASRTGLFEGARIYLSPTRSTDVDALELARELWTMVGAAPEVMDAAEHDRRLAWTSHLPQAVSTALACALAESDIRRSDLGPGGRDVTRLAGSSPEMWADILIDNAEDVGAALVALRERMQELGDAIRNGDRPRLHRLFSEARTWHQQDP